MPASSPACSSNCRGRCQTCWTCGKAREERRGKCEIHKNVTVGPSPCGDVLVVLFRRSQKFSGFSGSSRSWTNFRPSRISWPSSITLAPMQTRSQWIALWFPFGAMS
ncbi:MAG: hypothetical protein DYG96_12920 [Chlorobi bacterium CHB2]|nr:hypothetical protein [Chlorobi bacterium CHB2]